MDAFKAALNDFLTVLNNVIWHPIVLYVVMGVGVLFTIWSGFCQYRALTHGVSVTRGKFDDHDDPGAINHFQALSAALSATVGLGNIAGVAVAIALGGPGAVFWMWMIGLFGMALKSTEVTLSMLFRNTEDPDNPHGGPMFVASKGFAKMGLPGLGKLVGGIFVATLLISTITGGNMFQAWSVADLTKTYWDVPQVFTGIILAVVVGLVIIGGIKRIGAVAGRIVPFMVTVYLISAIYVLIMNAGQIPAMLKLIVTSAFSPADASGAFIGGTFAYAFLWGLKRALFSSEAGQGSSPIAHSAAKTNEPVREGVVAGLEPFIDTIVVCTITSMVILSSGIWNRDVDLPFENGAPQMIAAVDESGAPVDGEWTLPDTPISHTEGGIDGVYIIVEAGDNANSGNNLNKLNGEIITTEAADGTSSYHVEWDSIEHSTVPTVTSEGSFFNYKGPTLTAKAFDRTTPGMGRWMVTMAAWLFAISTMISWSYYGEQGVVFLFGDKSVFGYKVLYCVFIVLATLPMLISTDTELDNLTALGTGIMLWANIPIMLIFGKLAMDAWRNYMKKLDAGEFHAHEAATITEMVEGKEHEEHQD